MMPDLRGANPYQKLLTEGLSQFGVEVRFPVGYRRGLPFWRAWKENREARILHLHWLSPYLRGANIFTQAAYCLRLLIDVALVRASGVRVVWTIHNRVSHESKWPALEKWVQKRLVQSVDRVIVHAHASLAEVRNDFPVPAARVGIVPHGHYRAAYGPAVDSQAARAALGLPETGRVYLFFGMLRPYKGIEKLVQAWRKAECFGPSDTLLIAGAPCDREFLDRVTEMAAGCSNIKIQAAFVPPSKIPLIFSAADLVVLPFSSILTSGSLLLAMSYGKPIVAPRFGAIVETVGDADDLLYDPEDTEGLQTSLERSAGVPLGSLKIRTERMCEGLDWGTVAGLTLKAYNTALRGH